VETKIANSGLPRLGARLQLAGGLLIAGLLVELLSLLWIHPFAFLAFIFVACTLMTAGGALFLWSILVT